jgi:hypothetical protein
MRSREHLQATFSPNLVRQPFKFRGARQQGRQVKTIGLLDLPALPLASKALSVRAVATHHEPAIDQHGQMPAQGCRGHAMSSSDNCRLMETPPGLLPRQLILRIEAQQRIQQRKRSIGSAQHGLGFTDGPEQFPFLRPVFQAAFLRNRLPCQHGKRQRPSPERRR